MSIRFKVILPYLLLTLIVAVTGAYVVIRLVANSLEERLANQLLEAGRVVSDSMVRKEGEQVQSARVVSFTRGLGEALSAADMEQVTSLAQPVTGGLNIEDLMIVNDHGGELLHLLKQPNGTILDVSQENRATKLAIVEGLLAENDPNSLPKREVAQDPVDERYYYFTSLPVVSEDHVVGAVVVGTSLNTLLPILRDTSSSDVVIYDANGQAIASTLGSDATDPLFLRTISIQKTTYDEVINQDKVVTGRNFEANGRWFSLGMSPLRIGNDRIAVFAVILPLDFVVTSNSTNRTSYILMYSVAMIAVVLIGYFVTRLIINPLYSLVRTSRAIAGGDLTKRTGIKTRDEIGVLANTFDKMTENLQQRTIQLERTNRILEQMDRTKMRFINISAHELRTPLTLIQGYAQLIEAKSKDNAGLQKYSVGILDGTTRMVEIIDSMLDVSRIDMKQLDIHKAEIQVEPVMDRVANTFADALKERNIALTVDGLADLPALQADKELIYKVFYHVVMNAIKYTPDGGKVFVHGQVAEDHSNESEIEVTVRDTGIGIDPQNHDLVFEKFYQTGEVLMHSSGKTKFKGGGPGLGLAISRGILNAHGGRIWIESSGYNELTCPGTTVFIRLPLNGKNNESV